MKKKTLILLVLLIFCGLYLIYSKISPRPNVVLIIVDTLRDDKLGCYGYPADISPEIDEIASKGVRFKNVNAQNSWTRPSIGSMLTSLYPRSIGLYKEKFDILPDKYLTLPEILKSNGYTTLGITANPNINKFFNFHQGFDRYTDSHFIWRWMKPEHGKEEFSEKGVVYRKDFPDQGLVLKLLKGKVLKIRDNPLDIVAFDHKIQNEEQLAKRLKQIGVEDKDTVLVIWRQSQTEKFPTPCKTIFEEALDLARSANPQNPFYMQINIMEVHNPWLLLRPEFKKNFLNIKNKDGPWYHDAVKQVSYDIDLFIDRLLELPGKGNTLFIITSDHGEGLGDHPDVFKSKHHGRLLYESQLKVPLILYHPRPGESELIGWVRRQLHYYYLMSKEIEPSVRLLDLMPTLLDYLKISIPDNIEGKSLLDLIYKGGSKVDLPQYFVTETYFRDTNKIAVRSDKWKYIENRDGQEGVNLYELQLLGIKENGKVTDKINEEKEMSLTMKEYLRGWEKRYPKVEAVYPGRDPSNEEIQQLKSLGYLQ
jgi:arylsulfatase A-like enzyme